MLYSCFIHLYTLAIKSAALAGNDKARQWVQGRKHLMERISQALKPDDGPRYWVHCASLGEFEQGRPLIEALREEHPGCSIVLTFFSPSGYEIRKNYAGADYVWYLPDDTPRHAREFVRLVRPEKVFFIKYEFWRNYLSVLHKENIPTSLVSANFRPDQLFFKWYGGWYRKVLRCFSHLFVQNQRSASLLNGIGLTNVTVTGDTRFDRVCRIADEAGPIGAIARFVNGMPCIVAGSSWPPDEALLTEYLNTTDRPVKWILAPHEIDEAHVKGILASIRKKAVRYTQITDDQDLSDTDVLIVDNMGMLSAVYQYGRIGYIGGGFGRGIHNTLEAAVFGMPVLFGPCYKNFQEAVDLIACGGARSINTYDDLKHWLDTWLDQPEELAKAGKAAGAFVAQGKGATRTVLRTVFTFLTACLLVAGCSTQRNTPVSRTYHSVTTKYNVLFNGQEHFKAGLAAMEKAAQEDFTHVLPLMPLETGLNAPAGTDEFETAIMKAETAVSLHSIKAKPNFDQKRMSEAEQRFYSKNEFNPYIDKCYLLIGQSYFYLQDYYNAISTFDKMAELFPREPVMFTAELWRVRALLAQKDFKQADERLQALSNDRNLPEKSPLRDEISLLQTELLLRNGQYADALPLLNELEHRHSIKKNTRQRIGYIKAQLYELQNQPTEAELIYRKTAHSSAPYEMRFQAQLNHIALQAASGDREAVKHELAGMAKKYRNLERRNRIYYVLAGLYEEEGDMEQALPLYRQAAALSSTKDPLRAEACRRTADYFFSIKEYETAGLYYDSTLRAMSPNNAEYADLQTRSKNLNILSVHLSTVAREDSLQRLAALSEEEREELIAKYIEQVKEEKQKAEAQEEARLRQYYSQRARGSGNRTSDNGSMWYFYSNPAISRGKDEFNLRWGRRILEDDWRRSNRAVVYHPEGEALAEAVNDSVPERVTDAESHDFYTQDLPLEEAQLAASHQKIQDALMGSADVYSSYLEDRPAATQQYESLLSRYPETTYRAYACYALARLYEAAGDEGRVAAYRSLLEQEAPESIYTKLLSDPDWIARQNAVRETAEQWYQQTYARYQQRDDQAVISMADQALNLFAEDRSIPQFAYLRALSASRASQNIDTLRNQMQRVIDRYPGAPVAEAAQNILKGFARYTNIPSSMTAETAENDTVRYAYDKTAPQAFGWYLPAGENVAQVVFDLTDHNLDAYPETDLQIEQIGLEQESTLLIVTPFQRLTHAVTYFGDITGTPALTAHLKGEPVFFLIPLPDLEKVRETGSVRRYLRDFTSNYPELF